MKQITQFKIIFFLISFLLPSLSFADGRGHGRDGGWPESISLLKIAKENLLDLLNRASEEDIKEAINNMHDREEYYKPEQINLELLRYFINSVVDPDVLEIEQSTYNGIRLFDYDNSNPLKPKVFATKNFFNNSRYQVKISDISVSIIKEVQRLMLHEISHLWGFGEETEETNYAERFAVSMVQILHGANKKNFSQEEKLKAMSLAYAHLTIKLSDKNMRTYVDHKTYPCLAIDLNGEEASTKTFALTDKFAGLDGEEVQEKNGTSIYRYTADGFLFGETGYETFMQQPKISSHYFTLKGGSKAVTGYVFCHKDALQLKNIVKKFVAPYYSRASFLTDLSNSSTTMYRFSFLNKLSGFYSSLEEHFKVAIANQEQIIRNINYKIKVQNKDDYEWLISRRYKYSKPKDSEVKDRLNEYINSDLSNEGSQIYAQIVVSLKQLLKEVDLMKNNERRAYTFNLMLEFTTEFNDHVDKTKDIESDIKYNTFKCGKYRKIGEYYSCHLETAIKDAQYRIESYKKLMIEGQAISKKYQNRLMNYQE
ncbi:MAG: hypothetical protein ACOYL6_16525 [Bacteriovoracaceae bacterium]